MIASKYETKYLTAETFDKVLEILKTHVHSDRAQIRITPATIAVKRVSGVREAVEGFEVTINQPKREDKQP